MAPSSYAWKLPVGTTSTRRDGKPRDTSRATARASQTTGSLSGTNGDPPMKSKPIPKRNRDDLLLEETSQQGGAHAMGAKLDNAEIVSLKDRIRENKIEVERSVLIQALRKTGGNKAEAARLLQINYSTIHLKIKRYGIRLEP